MSCSTNNQIPGGSITTSPSYPALTDNASTSLYIDGYDNTAVITSSVSAATPIVFTFSIPYNLSQINLHNAWGVRDAELHQWYYKMYDASNTLLYTTVTYTEQFPFAFNTPGQARVVAFPLVTGVKKVELIVVSYANSRGAATQPFGQIFESLLGQDFFEPSVSC